MRKLLTSFILLLLLGIGTSQAQRSWIGDKYSMFIHYGLYSIPAGVFDGKPVTKGYSEQILTFGIGFSDWYEAYTKQFDAHDFNADSIVALAKAGGMRSIVMTAKHHDGFCLFHTATTKYNVYDATPAKRDLIGELAAACHRAGMGFGVYFSLIDWHFPGAMPFSSHNADPITPAHQRYNISQVRELLTKYGKVDEIWFDMGSLLPAQSKALYDLVHQLQPSCMVSGRLGNDYADFCVMADNEYPDYSMVMPWQTAASFFNETWGYRSWQKRGKPEDKVREKISSLINVVSDGGKYLLNIGPEGDGSVVPFEGQVIRRIGSLLAPIREAVYNTHANPYPHYVKTPPITLSSDHQTLYLFVPDSIGSVALPLLPEEPTSVTTLNGLSLRSHRYEGHTLHLMIERGALAKDMPYGVVKVAFSKPLVLLPSPHRPIEHLPLNTLLASPLFAQSSVDYYSSFKSILGYHWTLSSPFPRHLYLNYTDEELGKRVTLRLSTGGLDTLTFVRSEPRTIHVPLHHIHWLSCERATERGLFGHCSDQFVRPDLYKAKDWTSIPCQLPMVRQDTIRSRSGVYYRLRVKADRSITLPLQLRYHNGFLLYIDGRYFAGDLQRLSEGQTAIDRLLLLPLTAGTHTLLFKAYNRWGDTSLLSIQPLDHYTQYRQALDLFVTSDTLTVQKLMVVPYASPLSAYNLTIER